MGERIIVRTTANISYVGNVCADNKFKSEGLAIVPNQDLKMEIFIPKEEIKEVVYNNNIMSYDDYLEYKNP